METQANLVNGRSSASLSLNSQVLPASSDAAAPETNAPGQADGAVLAPADNNTRTPRDDGEPRSSGEGASLLASAESKQDSGSVVHQRECDNKAMGGGLSDARPAPIVTPPGGGVVFHSHFFGTPTPTSASASAASPSAAGGRRRHSHSASGANSGSRSSTGSVPRRRVSLNSGTTTPAARRRRSSAGIAPRRRRRSSAFQHDKHSLLGPIIHQKKDTWKETVWSLVDEPGSSHAARFIAVFIMSLIAVSCVTFCMETLPQFHRKDVHIWQAIEAVCIAFFTLEYVARFLSCPSKCVFLKGTLNTIDLVAIVPFYVELLLGSAEGSGSAVFRVVRLVRVFRVFKISRYVSWVKIFANAMYASAQPLGMLLFVMAIGCVVFSSAIYFAERGEWSEELEMYLRDEDGVMQRSPYQSIPASFWWCIITMTTVGYGDDYPVSTVGKLIAAVASLSGILVLAIPITVISTNFNYEFTRMKKKRDAMRQKMLMFKRQFGAKKTSGIGVIKDEIESLVRRNAAELVEDFQSVVQTSKDELGTELFALVQVAYAQRRRLMAQQADHDHTPDGGGAVYRVTEGSVLESPTAPSLGVPGEK